MKIKKWWLGVALAILFAATSGIRTASAWPDQPPTKAFISGPGLNGDVAITDPALLQALRLGGLEDFQQGALPEEVENTEPYKITRYFDGGSFRMGDLEYYPGSGTKTSMVYFLDGDMKNGDRSPFNAHWYRTIASSDKLLQAFIQGQTNAKQEAAWLVPNAGANGETIAFDANLGGARFALPKGLRSADGKAYWAAFPSGEATALHSFDVTNGTILASMGLQGNWEPGAVSRTGKWLALKRVPTAAEQDAMSKTGAWKTTLAMVDGDARKITRTFTLDGNFGIDALNNAGNMLYVIQHVPAEKPDHYLVRVYDVAKGELQEGALVDKREPNEVMEGYPTQQVTDGIWLYTLYVGMREGHAFIHALNLEQGYAWCLDLPSGNGDEATLEHYSLALALDRRTIYAANPVLGVIARNNVEALDDTEVVSFTPSATTKPGTARPPTGLVTPDGKTVLFGDGADVWQFDTAAQKVEKVEQGAIPVLGLAMNADGKALHLAYADHSVKTRSLAPLSAKAEPVKVTATQEETENECPVTKPPDVAFVPGAPYPHGARDGNFWYGTRQLWTTLPTNGVWSSLPQDVIGYTQKLPWWSAGYDGAQEDKPALKLSGRQLDGDAAFTRNDATNAFSPDFGGWAMMTGLEIPVAGCWAITGEYKGQTLRFVVEVKG